MTKLEEQLIKDEGFSSKPYKCTAGKLTIGYGRNIEDVGISRNEALFLLQEDIKKVKTALYAKLPFFKNLNDGRQNALINMGFNLGVNGLMKFKNTLRLMSEGKYEEASKEVLLSEWASQVGKRANRISDQIKNGF